MACSGSPRLGSPRCLPPCIPVCCPSSPIGAAVSQVFSKTRIAVPCAAAASGDNTKSTPRNRWNKWMRRRDKSETAVKDADTSASRDWSALLARLAAETRRANEAEGKVESFDRELREAQDAVGELKASLAAERANVMALALELEHGHGRSESVTISKENESDEDTIRGELACVLADLDRTRKDHVSAQLEADRLATRLEESKTLNAQLYQRLSGSAVDFVALPPSQDFCEVGVQTEEDGRRTRTAESELKVSEDPSTAAEELKEAHTFIDSLKRSLENERRVVLEQATELEHFYSAKHARDPPPEISDEDDTDVYQLELELTRTKASLAHTQERLAKVSDELEETKASNASMYARLSNAR